MHRWVLHIDMDAFFASVEQLTRPTLRGRPVLVAGVNGRGVVAGASYEARAFGARSAMPTYQAAQLIGYSAVLVSPRHAVYSAASRRVFELIARQVDVVEQLSIDEAFMEPAELRGASPGEVKAWADQLRALILAEVGLPSSIGAGSGKQIAKIASTQAKPDGTLVVPAATQLEMLHPLPVSKLWGVGPVTAAKLRLAGVDTIAELAALPEREATLILGSTMGPMLWQLARGIDERPVAPRAVAKQVSAEHTYGSDLSTRAQVQAAVRKAAGAAYRRLLRDGRAARTVTVKLKLADFSVHSRSLTLAYASDDYRTLESVAFKLLRYPAEIGAIRLVGVSFSGLEDARQDVLFPELDHVTESGTETESQIPSTDQSSGWQATQDVYHPEHGHGWIQGSGHGVVSVRFETRATGPGYTRTFSVDDPALIPADPLDSLAWEEPN